MSEDPNRRERDEELEALLRQLVPTPLNVDLVEELSRDRERTILIQAQSPTVIQWRRLIPLTLVGSLAMAGFGFLRYGDRFSSSPEAGGGALPVALVAEPPAGLTGDRFVPVSSHGFLLNTSSGGVVQTDEGPRQRLNLEYRDAYHWRDPETGTNIRLFQPRSEEVVVPLQTD